MARTLVTMMVLAVCLLARAPDAAATVYTWLEDGARHFTNSASAVPEQHRATARSFGTLPASEPPATATSPADQPGPVEPEASALEAAYGRGVERGAGLALAPTRAVGELARALVETALGHEPAPPPSAAPPAEHRPSRSASEPRLRVSIVPAGYRWPGGVGYGYVGAVGGCPGCCCASGLAGARRTPLFFPNGHQLDANLFLVGDGYWLD